MKNFEGTEFFLGTPTRLDYLRELKQRQEMEREETFEQRVLREREREAEKVELQTKMIREKIQTQLLLEDFSNTSFLEFKKEIVLRAPEGVGVASPCDPVEVVDIRERIVSNVGDAPQSVPTERTFNEEDFSKLLKKKKNSKKGVFGEIVFLITLFFMATLLLVMISGTFDIGIIGTFLREETNFHEIFS
ncbi:MAG: hypothetical protein FWD89_00080 [Firmicutes bacterium]|nr:hypothetical protein [Bacillota bacterium]